MHPENEIALVFLGSKRLALALAAVIAKIPGNGGELCFDVMSSTSLPGTNARKVWQINFLPDTFARMHPDICMPNTDTMSGFLRGYQYAARTNLSGLDFKGRLKIR